MDERELTEITSLDDFLIHSSLSRQDSARSSRLRKGMRNTGIILLTLGTLAFLTDMYRNNDKILDTYRDIATYLMETVALPRNYGLE